MVPSNAPPPDVPDDAPRVADGRYVLLRRLGEGGMAVVYAAWDLDLRIWRAVKVLLPEFAKRSSVRRRFEREARTMMSIRHPNLVRVHEVRAERVLPYLVMDLVPGGSLEDWTLRHGPMPTRLVAEVGVQVVQGLVAVHDAGIIHRDIKPQNVLVDLDETCRLTDFGIAQLKGEGDTKTGVSMGTLGYMAPEQFADSKSVDVRSDIYSVGASLFVLLTKRPVRDLFRLADDPEGIAALEPDLGPVLAKCLGYEREERYPDAGRLLAALVEVRDRLPPIPEAPPLARPVREGPPGGSAGEFTELQGMLEVTHFPTAAEEKRSPPLRATVLLEPTVLERDERPRPSGRRVAYAWFTAALSGVASALAVGAATAIVVLVGVPLALMTGKSSVDAARSDVDDAERILVERVAQPDQVAHDLAAVRATPPGPPDDPVAFGRAVAASARPAIAARSTDPDIEVARQRLERVVWAVDHLETAEARLEAASDDPLGRLAISAGLTGP